MSKRRFQPPGSLSETAEQFAEARADYSAAKRSRFRRTRPGMPASGSHADYHYRSEPEWLRMMETARDMDRSDCVVGQVVDRAVANQVQDGIRLDVDTGDDELDDRLTDKWEEWSTQPELCDLAGELAFADMEALAQRHAIVDGDCFALPNTSGALELVEAHRCRTPTNSKRNIVHGVELSETRQRLRFLFTKEDIDPMMPLTRVGDTMAIDARDKSGHRQVFQNYNPKRFSQTRGITAFAPIVDLAGMHDDIQFAKLVQQQVVSCFAIFRQRELDFQPTTGSAAATGERITTTRSDGSREVREGVSPGQIIDGQPGEKLMGFSPNVPNPEYFDHVRLILSLIGINLGLPLVMVLLDASQTNFSGWRGAVDQPRLAFRLAQHALIRRFHRPTYRWKVRQWIHEEKAIARLAAKVGPAAFKHKWNPPKWKYIEPLKDATADLLMLRNGMTSPRRHHNGQGDDFYQITEERIFDNAFAIRRAKKAAAEINREFPDDPVHWREILALPTPDGVQIKLGGESNSKEDTDQ